LLPWKDFELLLEKAGNEAIVGPSYRGCHNRKNLARPHEHRGYQ
jgi:hypothetical protein